MFVWNGETAEPLSSDEMWLHASVGLFREQYAREETEIRSFCTDHGLRWIDRDDMFYVISRDDTAWKIVPDPAQPGRLCLYHESFKGNRYKRRETPYPQRSFHRQHIARRSICAYLQYIVGHDRYVENAPPVEREPAPVVHGSRKSKKREKARKISQRRREIARVHSLIDSLDSDYNPPRAMLIS